MRRFLCAGDVIDRLGITVGSPATMLAGEIMTKSRREFLSVTSAGLIGAAIVPGVFAQDPQPQQLEVPGAPTAFGTGPLVGPEISPETVREAEKLVQIKMSDSDVAVAASSWRPNMAAIYERRTGPRKVELESTLVPATQWNPVLAATRPANPA